MGSWQAAQASPIDVDDPHIPGAAMGLGSGRLEQAEQALERRGRAGLDRDARLSVGGPPIAATTICLPSGEKRGA